MDAFLGSDIQRDDGFTPQNDATITWSVRDKTTSGFTVYLREAAGIVQAIRLDLTVTK